MQVATVELSQKPCDFVPWLPVCEMCFHSHQVPRIMQGGRTNLTQGQCARQTSLTCVQTKHARGMGHRKSSSIHSRDAWVVFGGWGEGRTCLRLDQCQFRTGGVKKQNIELLVTLVAVAEKRAGGALHSAGYE